MQVTITKPGLLSTIQDLGRYHYLSQAVPVSGAMDTLAARIANKAVGNHDSAAVIEFTYADAGFNADTDLLVAYAGDGAILKVGELTIPDERPVFVPAGSSVKLVNDPAGSRTYLAIAGGWDVPMVLGSRSTFITARLGGLKGRALKKGDVLASAELSDRGRTILNALREEKVAYTNWSIPRSLLLPADRKTIRIVPGHELTWFTGSSISDILSAPFQIGRNSDRMGYHLTGERMRRAKTEELLSTAVTPGTIQVTGSGEMIILMADCQTTGGYPRIARVAAVDMPLCAQLKPGDTINFNAISRQEAEKLYIDREHELQQLDLAVLGKI